MADGPDSFADAMMPLVFGTLVAPVGAPVPKQLTPAPPPVVAATGRRKQQQAAAKHGVEAPPALGHAPARTVHPCVGWCVRARRVWGPNSTIAYSNAARRYASGGLPAAGEVFATVRSAVEVLNVSALGRFADQAGAR